MPRLARAWNGVKAPPALSGIGIVSIDEAANAVLAAGNPNRDQVLHCQRRNGKAVSGAIVGGGHVPNHVARLGIERDHVRIERSHENLVVQDGQPAIHAPAAGTDIRRQLPLIQPDRPPCPCVEGESAVVLPSGVENPVDHKGRGLKLAGGRGLVNPLGGQRGRVAGINLPQRAETLPRVVAGISQPVLRLFVGVQQALECDLGMSANRKNEGQTDDRHPVDRTWPSFVPPALDRLLPLTHGLRRGLHSFAASRLPQKVGAGHAGSHFAPTLVRYATMSSRSLSLKTSASYFGIADSRLF